jgi:hypothetical protein
MAAWADKKRVRPNENNIQKISDYTLPIWYNSRNMYIDETHVLKSMFLAYNKNLQGGNIYGKRNYC